MPLYLVRWPTMRASLVSARNKDDLLDILDQLDDPGGCTFQVYRGPVWVDFNLPFKIRDVTPEKKVPTDPSDFTVDPTDEFVGDPDGGPIASITAPETDDAIDMCEAVLRGAFPKLHAYLKKERELGFTTDNTDPDAEPERYPDELRAALVSELTPLVRMLQARAALNQRDDYEAAIMKKMRVTTMLPYMKRAVERTLEAVPAKDAD